MSNGCNTQAIGPCSHAEGTDTRLTACDYAEMFEITGDEVDALESYFEEGNSEVIDTPAAAKEPQAVAAYSMQQLKKEMPLDFLLMRKAVFLEQAALYPMQRAPEYMNKLKALMKKAWES